MIDMDESAHAYEHSIEVQLPFLQYLYGSAIRIVPICMGFQDLDTSRNLGEAIAEATKSRNVVVIASTDMTHQEPQQSATRKDRLVLDAIEAMDEERVQKTVREPPDHHVWIRPRLRCNRRLEEAGRRQGRNLIIPHERGYNG